MVPCSWMPSGAGTSSVCVGWRTGISITPEFETQTLPRLSLAAPRGFWKAVGRHRTAIPAAARPSGWKP